MKNLFLFFVSILGTLSLNAQKKNTESVAEAVELLRRTMISGNADSLAMLVADKLSYESTGQLKILTPIEREIITSTLQECLNLKGNATSKIKAKLTNVLNMLVENAD